MQQFAVASVYPRSIAWIIRPNDPSEWDRFEQIIKYNCAMIGGYFNVMVPLSDQDEVFDKYQQFLINFDPDLVVLAPDMESIQPASLRDQICPFAFVPWDHVSQIATYDPRRFESGTNATLGELKDRRIDYNQWIEHGISPKYMAAVAKKEYPNTSRLALVACGDIESGKESLNDLEKSMLSCGIIPSGKRGYHKQFLEEILKPKYKPNDVEYNWQNGEIIPPPDRYNLAEMVHEGNQFPLFDSIEILDTCRLMQLDPPQIISFINLTKSHYRGKTTKQKSPFNIVILVSDNFGLEEAILFWNLRANEVDVVWLSFSKLETDINSILDWLEKLSRGSGVCGVAHTGECKAYTVCYPSPKDLDIVFSSPNNDIDRLGDIFNTLKDQENISALWRIETYNKTIVYNYLKSDLEREHVMVAQKTSKSAFIPKMPQDTLGGMFTVTLEWDGLMLPQNDALVKLTSSEKVKSYTPSGEDQIEMSRFRITKDHFLKVQTNGEDKIEFNRPSTEQIIEILFTSAGFSRIERSSTAKYHTDFITRAGSLEEAARYVATSPYSELFKYLSDDSNDHKIGWLLKHPDKRRVLHHIHIRKILKHPIPPETEKYFDTVSDELPNEVVELLEKRVLERGFLVKCDSCDFKSWYPAEHLGQVFKCSRCYQTQIYRSNPLWLYKLSEVTFQGFKCDMVVPILALNYLKHRSQHCFEWVPDSDVYGIKDSEETNKNIDIVCVCDGRLFIGEAKSNDEIPGNQFSFYEDLCKRLEPDGIVFATSKSKWKQGTKDRIEKLKEWFRGEIIELTSKELYPSQSNENA